MRVLHARDILSNRVVKADAEARPADVLGAVEASRATHVAVFDGARFCGLVRLQDILRSSPQRIFADLLPANPPAPVAVDTPLDEIGRLMSTSDADAVTVVDGDGSFVGAVTQQSLLEGLLREKHYLLEESERLRAAVEICRAGFSSIVEKNADGILIVAQDGMVRFVNPAARTLLNRKAKELIGSLFGFPVVTGEMVEIDILRPGGEPGIAEMRLAETDWQGEPAGLVMLRDITERKRAEIKLRAANAELFRSNTELDQFAHVASHDLQEPVRKLIAFSDLLAKDLGEDLPEQAARYLAFIEDAAQRMHALMQDLLTLSRAGRATTKHERISLNDCADRALEALATRVEETGAQVTRDELPDIVGDATMLTQLYQNLIGNALKFVAPDRRPVIRLTAERINGERVFGVCDNGIGLKPEYAEQIFVAFKRLHGRSEYDGSGIGLAICRKTVERHGGRIWVESELGKGAHFKFTISGRLEVGECQSETAEQPAFC